MKSTIMTVLAVLAAVCITGSMCQAQTADTGPKTVADMKAEVAALQARLQDAEASQKGTPLMSQVSRFGKELGSAFNGFVESLDGGMKVTIERLNEFASTDVGRFAMICIAWKVFATDMLGVARSAVNKILGFVFLAAFCWVLKRFIEVFFWGRLVITKREGPFYNRVIARERTEPVVKAIKSADADQTTVYCWGIGVYVVSMLALFISATVAFTH